MENTNMTEEKQVVGLPRIGAPAPEFEAVTSHGPIKLSDYKGKWVVPVLPPVRFHAGPARPSSCAFAEIHPKLREMNTELIGLSVDSVFSHIAWVRNIEEKLGIKITFPVIADLDMKVAKLYGMINARRGDHGGRQERVRHRRQTDRPGHHLLPDVQRPEHGTR